MDKSMDDDCKLESTVSKSKENLQNIFHVDVIYHFSNNKEEYAKDIFIRGIRKGYIPKRNMEMIYSLLIYDCSVFTI